MVQYGNRGRLSRLGIVKNLSTHVRTRNPFGPAQSNRLEAHLKIYFPQIPRWFGDLGSPLVCALLERWPTLEALQKARPDTLRSFFRKHHSRKEELIESRIKAIGEAMPALKDRAVVEAKVVVKVLVQLIQVLHEGIEGLNRQIQEAAEAHPDFF